jgi:hypothetical protein
MSCVLLPGPGWSRPLTGGREVPPRSREIRNSQPRAGLQDAVTAIRTVLNAAAR